MRRFVCCLLLGLSGMVFQTPAQAGVMDAIAAFFDRSDQATATLTKEGYTNIRAKGSRVFTICGKNVPNTEFSATNKAGKPVTGYVCHTLFGDGVHFD